MVVASGSMRYRLKRWPSRTAVLSAAWLASVHKLWNVTCTLFVERRTGQSKKRAREVAISDAKKG